MEEIKKNLDEIEFKINQNLINLQDISEMLKESKKRLKELQNKTKK